MSRATEARQGRENQYYCPKTGTRIVAGCICLDEAKEKVVMVSSTSHPNKWVLPKGGVELDEVDSFVQTAIRETWEEAGVEGKITQKLPIVQDSRGSKAPVVKGDFDPAVVVPKSEFHFYEMIVDNLSKTWPESSFRQRRWCTYSEAKHELEKANRPELVEALNSSAITKDNTGEY